MVFPLTWTMKLDTTGTNLGGTPTFTDVTDYVMTGDDTYGTAIQVTDGRQDEQSDVTPAQMSATFNNNDHRFTPVDSAGAYFPNLTAGVRARLQANVNSTTIDYYDGYADSWHPYLSPDRSFALCDASFTDILGRFGQSTPLRSILNEHLTLQSPAIWAPMTDQYGATIAGWQAIILGGTSAWTVPSGSAFTFGASGPPGDPSGAVTLTGTAATSGAMWGVTWPSGSYPSLGTLFTVLVFYMGGALTKGRPLTVTLSSGDVLALDISGASGAQVVKAVCGSTVGSGASIATVGPGTPQMLALSAVTSGGSTTVTATVYQGGWPGLTINASDTATSSLSSTDVAGLTMGGQIVAGAQSHFMPGTYAHLAVFDSVVSVSDVQSAGLQGFAGDTTHQRLSRYLTYRPGSSLYADTCTEFVGLHDITGLTMQQALFDVAHVEQSPLFVKGDGQVRMWDQAVITSPTSVLTLDCSTGSGVQPSLSQEASNQYLLNHYEVTPASGNVQTWVDGTSQLKYGYYSNTLQAPFQRGISTNPDQAAFNAAQRAVNTLKDPILGAGTVEVDLMALAYSNPALCAQVLQLRTGQVFTLTNLPAPFKSPLDVIVMGRSLSASVSQASLTFSTFGSAAGITWRPTGAVL